MLYINLNGARYRKEHIWEYGKCTDSKTIYFYIQNLTGAVYLDTAHEAECDEVLKAIDVLMEAHTI